MKPLALIVIFIVIVMLGGCAAPSAPQKANFQFVYRQTEIEIDAEAAPIIAALGEPISYTEQASCAFDGLDKTYHFGGFYLATYPKDGKDFISQIWFADDSVSTQEGIRIGSSRQEVELSYAEPFGDKNSITLVQKDSKLTIILKDGVVAAIRYERIME